MKHKGGGGKTKEQDTENKSIKKCLKVFLLLFVLLSGWMLFLAVVLEKLGVPLHEIIGWIVLIIKLLYEVSKAIAK